MHCHRRRTPDSPGTTSTGGGHPSSWALGSWVCPLWTVFFKWSAVGCLALQSRACYPNISLGRRQQERRPSVGVRSGLPPQTWCSSTPTSMSRPRSCCVRKTRETCLLLPSALCPQAYTRRGGRMRLRRSCRGRRMGENTFVVDVKAGNELGPTPSPFPMLSKRDPVPPPPMTKKRVWRSRRWRWPR